MLKLRYCDKCGQYTLKETHCNQKTRSAHPAKYSPQDKYGEYRAKAREKTWKNSK